MCGRYRLNRGWERDMQGMLAFVNEKLDIEQYVGQPDDRLDVRPTDPMPVIRIVDGRLLVEMRRWGFLALVSGPPDKRTGRPGKRVRKALFNAKSETAATSRAFRRAFVEQRCLIPLTSWYEWPEREEHGSTVKRRVEIASATHRTMFAAGLCETSTSFDTNAPVATFTMLTTSPTEFLGTIHDRAPLIVPERHHADWLAGDVAQARALTGVPPDAHDYALRDVTDDVVDAPSASRTATRPVEPPRNGELF